jgi:tetratricopeptide (TPR) repeat protein
VKVCIEVRSVTAAYPTPTPTPLVAVTPAPSVGGFSAQDYFDRGAEEVGNGNWQGAIRDYTEAIRLEHDNAAWFEIRDGFFMDLKQYGKAISDYTEASQSRRRRRV